jgi:hypothetical protein
MLVADIFPVSIDIEASRFLLTDTTHREIRAEAP